MTYARSHNHLATLLSLLGFVALGNLLCVGLAVCHVLLHVERGLSLVIHVPVEDAQLLLIVRLEGDHVLERHSLPYAAAVHPKTVDGGLVDAIRFAHLVAVEVEAHEVLVCYQSELFAEVRDLGWVEVKDDLEESGAVATTLVESLLAEGDSSDEDVGGLYELLDV